MGGLVRILDRMKGENYQRLKTEEYRTFPRKRGQNLLEDSEEI